MNKALKAELKRFKTYFDSLQRDGQFMYLGQLLQWSARKYADRTALIWDNKEISYHELYARAVQFSYVLKEQGVNERDTVLMFIENSPAFYVAYFGILQLGAVVAPLNTFLKERELTHIINDAKPKLIVASRELASNLTAVGVDSIPVLVVDDTISFEEPYDDEFLDITVPHINQDELAVLLYTSGTTGLPKGVMLSSRNALYNVVQGASRIEVLEHMRGLCILPLFHSFAQNTCVWACIFLGATVILVPKISRRGLLDGLKLKPTIFLGVPALYGLLCMLKTAPVDSVEYFISGGDALPDKIRSAFALIYGRKICNGYGLTETSPFISVDLDDQTEPTSNVGLPVLGIDVEIRDEGGNVLPQGQVGLLWVKGHNVMLGYYNAPEATEKVLKNGWLDTGDLAYLDKSGKIVISGREKDLIISKGLNIYPQEIENVILGHPNVLRVGVIGKPDSASGEVPIAYVQVRKDDQETIKQIRKLCNDNLASYKVPVEFIITADDLATTATGKVDKKVLRAQLKK